jgi:hypothetical protein
MNKTTEIAAILKNFKRGQILKAGAWILQASFFLLAFNR